MLHTQTVTPDPADTPGLDSVEGSIRIVDRVSPLWVTALSILFTLASGVCLLTVPVMGLYFQSFPDANAGFLATLLLGLVGSAAVLSAVLLDFAQTRALVGYRSLRERVGRQTRLWIGVAIAFTLALVHPALCLAPALAAAIALGVRAFWRQRAWCHEPDWDFDRHEAASLLSGRDGRGFQLAARKPAGPAFQASLHRGLVWLSVLVTMAVASALASDAYIGVAAIPALCLLSLWASDAIVSGLRTTLEAEGAKVPSIVAAAHDGVEEPDESGLTVTGLQIQNCQSGEVLLQDLDFDVPPGSMTAVIGDSGAGKTLLLKALQDPLGLDGLEIVGQARLNGAPLWSWGSDRRVPKSVLLPQIPLLLPTSGENNLTCFNDEAADRGKRLLDQLLFSRDDVEAVCAAPDPDRLPNQQRRLLAAARAFLLSPGLYLIDRPEDGLSERAIAAFGERLAQEKRRGRSILIVTENRSLLELCDQIMVLQQGRLIDVGMASELRASMTAGWSRLVADRCLESEDNLVLWVRNLFKRRGDEGNRRTVARLAGELLAMSVQSIDGATTSRVTFEFLHMKNQCLLRMIDAGPIPSSGALDRARGEASSGKHAMSPLATILRGSASFDCFAEDGRRITALTIQTYDPRETRAVEAEAQVPAP